jgi:transporter family-2 protein
MSWLLFLAALAAGTANPFQSGLNAELNKQIGQPLWASIVVYSTGLMGLIVLLLCFYRELP